MSESRFKVTVLDRETKRMQVYDVERVLMALCQPTETGDAYIIGMRAMNPVALAEAFATLFDRMCFAVSTQGGDVNALVDLLGEKIMTIAPEGARVVNYGVKE
jgi:hypothetical protein